MGVFDFVKKKISKHEKKVEKAEVAPEPKLEVIFKKVVFRKPDAQVHVELLVPESKVKALEKEGYVVEFRF